MLLRHQYLKFAYVDVVLMVSKMFRGNLTARILAIGVTVVLISEIDTISAWIWYILSMPWYKKYVMLQIEDYQGAIWEVFAVVKSAHLQSVWLRMFCLVSHGKYNFIYLNSALKHFW